MPFILTAEDIENDCGLNGLDGDDIGRWACVLNGCIFTFDTEERCREIYKYVFCNRELS